LKALINRATSKGVQGQLLIRLRSQMSSHFRQQELPKSPKATSNETNDIQIGLSQLPPEMVREISSFCDVKVQFRYYTPPSIFFTTKHYLTSKLNFWLRERLQLASKEISSCLRKFCRRFFSQKFVDAEVFDSALLLDRFEAFGELEVYFEDGAVGLSAIAAINRSNLTYLDLTANFPIKAELKDAFYAAWAALPAASFRNLRTLVACGLEGSVPTSFLETILRCAPPSLIRLSLELGGSSSPSTHLELAQRFQNARNVSLSLDYLASTEFVRKITLLVNINVLLQRCLSTSSREALPVFLSFHS
jgi:hypothetical protein